MESSFEYRRRAAEADAKAEDVFDLNLKRSWRQCAASWRTMAERAERAEKDAEDSAG